MRHKLPTDCFPQHNHLFLSLEYSDLQGHIQYSGSMVQLLSISSSHTNTQPDLLYTIFTQNLAFVTSDYEDLGHSVLNVYHLSQFKMPG